MGISDRLTSKIEPMGIEIEKHVTRYRRKRHLPLFTSLVFPAQRIYAWQEIHLLPTPHILLKKKIH
jgi:hypothetical protein